MNRARERPAPRRARPPRPRRRWRPPRPTRPTRRAAPMADTAIHGSIAAETEHGVPSHETSTGISNEKLAMWVFLGSDCLLLGGLISTYLLLRHRSVSGPSPQDMFDIPFTSVSSFVLLMSSMTMALAVGAIHRGDVRRCVTFLATTASLGGIFIAGQVYEFTTFVKEGLGYTTNIFGSAF